MAWQLGLQNAMKDPSLVVIKSNLAVVIKDKFPKAKHHFLVLPLEDIPSIFKVRSIDPHCEFIAPIPLMVPILAAKETPGTVGGDGVVGPQCHRGAGREGGPV